MNEGRLHKLAAFAEVPGGGNPAGVWVGNKLPDPNTMQQIAADVGFSETAFVAPATGRARRVRYFSPQMEVPFCGHATIATGAVLGADTGAGDYRLSTSIGDVPVSVQQDGERYAVSLESVDPSFEIAPDDILRAVLPIIGWREDELEPSIPAAIAYAGARHLVLAAANERRLRQLGYDFEALLALMREHDLITLQLIWRESDELIHSRNPFPVGGVVEDPATGAAAAALGGYLRNAGLVTAPATLTIRQGEDMGRPSVIHVAVPISGGIVVSGSAIQI